MSDYSGIYIFFALFCGVPSYDTPPLVNAAWIQLPPQFDEALPEVCYIERDPGFPAPWTGLPGADPEYYDI